MAESIDQYELAAAERLYDGLAIALDPGRSESRGSVYLFGYVIEMVLKAAFFRVVGSHAADPSDSALIAREIGRRRLQGAEFHNLALLHEALVSARRSRRPVLENSVAAELRRRIERCESRWDVDMRYDGSRTTDVVVAEMLDDASWFIQHLAVLAN